MGSARALAQIRETWQTRTKPLVEALAAWAKARRALKGSRLGESVTYLNNQWDGLLVFLEDPRVPLRNNVAERCVRGPVVGRKNIAGCKSVRGTEVAAVLCTLLESAKLAGVEPRAYLRAASEAALTGGPPLLPHVYREQLRAERATRPCRPCCCARPAPARHLARCVALVEVATSPPLRRLAVPIR